MYGLFSATRVCQNGLKTFLNLLKLYIFLLLCYKHAGCWENVENLKVTVESYNSQVQSLEPFYYWWSFREGVEPRKS